MSDIIRVDLSATTATVGSEGGGGGAPRHVFEIHTADTQFYVGEVGSSKDRQSGAGGEDSGRGVECAQRMAKAIRQAWLPVTSVVPTDAAVALAGLYCSAFLSPHSTTPTLVFVTLGAFHCA